MPKVSVITCVRDGMSYFPQTVASIYSQTFTDWEYIIVDDASRDGTPQFVERLMEDDRRVRLVRRERSSGPYLGALEGSKYASGQYIARIDGDDLAHPSRLAKQIEFMTDDPGLRACGTYIQEIDATGIPRNKFSRPTTTSGTLKWELALRCSIVHSSAFVERLAFEDVYGTSPLTQKYIDAGERGEYVPDVEDYRMWCRLSVRGWVRIIPQVLGFWRKHPRSIGATRQTEQQKLALDVMKEHVEAITKIDTTAELLNAFKAIGLSASFPINKGLEALKVWEAEWQKDPSLEILERKILTDLTLSRRSHFLRNNARMQPLSFLRNIIGY